MLIKVVNNSYYQKASTFQIHLSFHVDYWEECGLFQQLVSLFATIFHTEADKDTNNTFTCIYYMFTQCP